MPDGLLPGDLLATRGDGWTSALIRLGAALLDHPNMINHIAIVHHRDATGTLWCIEGRPGGVGWRDAQGYLGSHWTLCNTTQPKSDKQRAAIAKGAEALIGTEYDWAAIAADAGQAFRLGQAWSLKWRDGQVPGQVVCSSLAAYLYDKTDLDHPPGDRKVSPANWVDLWVNHDWATRPHQTA